MQDSHGKIHLGTFRCHTDDCCPEVFFDPEAPPEKAFVMTDDFGGAISFSRANAQAMVDKMQEFIGPATP